MIRRSRPASQKNPGSPESILRGFEPGPGRIPDRTAGMQEEPKRFPIPKLDGEYVRVMNPAAAIDVSYARLDS
jgi:hypothetical protein